jgi:hypothetical protein
VADEQAELRRNLYPPELLGVRSSADSAGALSLLVENV